MAEQQEQEREEELAPVHYLPTQRADEDGPSAGQGEVLDAELISEEEYQRLFTHKGAALDRYRGYKNDLVRTGRGLRTVATHQYTTRSAKFAARHGVFLVGGTWDLAAQAYKRWTLRDIDERIAAAQAAGEHGTAAQLTQQKIESKKLFVERIKAFGQLLRYTPHTILGISVAGTVATLITSIVAGLQPGGAGFGDIWSGLFDALSTMAGWSVWAVTTGLPSLGLLLVTGLVATGYNRRRTRGDAPDWAQHGASTPTQAVPIDETAIAQALGALGLTSINQHFKQGLPLQYTIMPHRAKNEDGEKDVGVSAQVRLPGGASTEDVIKKSKTLAASLARASVEVWPSTGEDEGLLDLWVADRGALDGSVGAWPWLERVEAVDLYAGVPVGRTLDGRTITAPVDGASYLVGGRPGQGKSQFVRTLTAGALLDPRARIRVHVLANNNDFAPMRKRLEKYVTGLGAEAIEAVLAEMTELYDEIQRRGQYMEAHGYDTASDAGFEPIVSVFDEIHTAFQYRDKDTREAIAAYAEDIAKLGRKYGLLVIYSTQSADASSIPKGVTRQSQQRIAYSVADQPANDGLLGSGSYKQGITATTLRPGNKSYHGDRGKSVTVGLVPDADWAMCQGYYIDSAALPALVEHALQLQAQAGTETVAALAAEPEHRDLLEDLDQVLGTEPIPSSDVPSLLRDLAPSWSSYRHLDGKKLRALLESFYDLKVPSTGNRFPLDPARVRQALAERATQDLDEDA